MRAGRAPDDRRPDGVRPKPAGTGWTQSVLALVVAAFPTAMVATRLTEYDESKFTEYDRSGGRLT